MEKNKRHEVFNATSSALGLLAIALASFPKHLRRKWFWKEFNGECQDCGKKWTDGWMLEFHHKIPESVGGRDVLKNAVLLCQECHALAHAAIGQLKAVALIQDREKKSGGRRRGW